MSDTSFSLYGETFAGKFTNFFTSTDRSSNVFTNASRAWTMATKDYDFDLDFDSCFCCDSDCDCDGHGFDDDVCGDDDRGGGLYHYHDLYHDVIDDGDDHPYYSASYHHFDDDDDDGGGYDPGPGHDPGLYHGYGNRDQAMKSAGRCHRLDLDRLHGVEDDIRENDFLDHSSRYDCHPCCCYCCLDFAVNCDFVRPGPILMVDWID